MYAPLRARLRNSLCLKLVLSSHFRLIQVKPKYVTASPYISQYLTNLYPIGPRLSLHGVRERSHITSSFGGGGGKGWLMMTLVIFPMENNSNIDDEGVCGVIKAIVMT